MEQASSFRHLSRHRPKAVSQQSLEMPLRIPCLRTQAKLDTGDSYSPPPRSARSAEEMEAKCGWQKAIGLKKVYQSNNLLPTVSKKEKMVTKKVAEKESE